MQPEDQQPACILIADSEVLVRHAIADYLRQCGYTVFEAASSDEAQIVLKDAGVPVSVVLCDAQIAGSLNGFALRAWARQHRGDAQFILAGDLVRAANAAAELCEEGPHLKRPYDPQGVVDYIRRLLASGRPSADG